MRLYGLVSDVNLKTWFIVHVLLGITCTLSKFILISYFYLVGAYLLIGIISNRNDNRTYAFGLVYLSSFELLSRMSQCSPFIPYEIGKYLVFFLLLLGVNRRKGKNIIGLSMFLCLLPALFFDFSGEVVFKEIVFNILGPMNVALAIYIFKDMRFSIEDLYALIRAMILPIISVVIYLIVKTPNFSNVTFDLGANFAASAGFGPNQVSTALGLGLFLSFYMLSKGRLISGWRTFDIILFVMLLVRGLLTFSRGGVLGGIVGILVLILLGNRMFVGSIVKSKVRGGMLYLIPVLLVGTLLTNSLTDGNLLLRYKGETAGTLAGTKEKSLNSITTNRFDILLGDIELGTKYLFTGAGVGASRYLRPVQQGTLAHVEFSRLIAEHGIIGVIYCLLMMYIIRRVWLNSKRDPSQFLIALMLVGVYTTFHAATRTYISPIAIGIACISVYNRGRINPALTSTVSQKN